MKFLKYWGPVILWMGIIFFFSTRTKLSVSAEDVWNFVFFKSLHLVEYAALYFLTYRAVSNMYPRVTRTQWAMWTFIVVILFATSDEMHQIFVSSREGRVRDVIIDTLGACFAWITLEKLLPLVPKKLQMWVARWVSIHPTK